MPYQRGFCSSTRRRPQAIQVFPWPRPGFPFPFSLFEEECMLMPASSRRVCRVLPCPEGARTSEAFDHPGRDGDARFEVAPAELPAALMIYEEIRSAVGL